MRVKQAIWIAVALAGILLVLGLFKLLLPLLANEVVVDTSSYGTLIPLAGSSYASRIDASLEDGVSLKEGAEFVTITKFKLDRVVIEYHSYVDRIFSTPMLYGDLDENAPAKEGYVYVYKHRDLPSSVVAKYGLKFRWKPRKP